MDVSPKSTTYPLDRQCRPTTERALSFVSRSLRVLTLVQSARLTRANLDFLDDRDRILGHRFLTILCEAQTNRAKVTKQVQNGQRSITSSLWIGLLMTFFKDKQQLSPENFPIAPRSSHPNIMCLRLRGRSPHKVVYTWKGTSPGRRCNERIIRGGLWLCFEMK